MVYAIAAAAVLLLAIVLVLARREAHDLRLRRLTLRFENLPDSFDGYTIVFASDFHVARFGAYERKVLAEIARLEGDLLVLGGDFQDHRKKSPDSAMAFVDQLARSADRFADGIVAVRGNHDSRPMRQHLRRQQAIRYLGRTPLLIERRGRRIAIAGARKTSPKRSRRLAREVRRIADSLPDDVTFRILVAHPPDYYPHARRHGFDLVLSGDTHGGQIRLPLIGAVVRKTTMPARYAYGLLREGRSILYTTSGVGTRGVRLRLLCPPEIVVFNLRRSPGEDTQADGWC